MREIIVPTVFLLVQPYLKVNIIVSKHMSAKIGVFHPLHAWGGGEAVAFWTLEALKNDDYQIDLMTFSDDIDFERIDEYYGTSLKDSAIKIISLPKPFYLRPFYSRKRGMLILHHYGLRCLKRLQHLYDLVICTYNEMDCDKLGIQYIHFPSLAEFELRARNLWNPPDLWYYQNPLFRRCYHAIARKLSKFSVEKMQKHVTLTNSFWTRNVIKQIYNIDARVVYPPVVGDFPDMSWEKRENGFLAIGRIAPEKRLENVIAILSLVRKAGYAVHLHIVGPFTHPEYAKKILTLAKESGSWVKIEGKVSRQELAELLMRHKYGIHGMENEHFGIAVAEMVKAGMIVFVPNSGGAAEIVNHSMLTYDTLDFAAQKIVQVLSDSALQMTLREHLATRKKLFSCDRFIQEIRSIVKDTLSKGS